MFGGLFDDLVDLAGDVVDAGLDVAGEVADVAVGVGGVALGITKVVAVEVVKDQLGPVGTVIDIAEGVAEVLSDDEPTQQRSGPRANRAGVAQQNNRGTGRR
jgi:hypothetical protein